jgi:hypothetical protein
VMRRSFSPAQREHVLDLWASGRTHAQCGKGAGVTEYVAQDIDYAARRRGDPRAAVRPRVATDSGARFGFDRSYTRADYLHMDGAFTRRLQEAMERGLENPFAGASVSAPGIFVKIPHRIASVAPASYCGSAAAACAEATRRWRRRATCAARMKEWRRLHGSRRAKTENGVVGAR